MTNYVFYEFNLVVCINNVMTLDYRRKGKHVNLFSSKFCVFYDPEMIKERTHGWIDLTIQLFSSRI